MAVVGETRVFRNGAWKRRGRADYTNIVPDPDPEPEPTPTFTLGLTEPIGSNSGAGVIRAYPTTVINGNVSVANGQTVADRIINGYVDIAIGGTLENCVVRGPATQPTSGGRPLVRVNGHTPTPGGTRANIRFCDVRPQTPSAFFDGIGYKGYYAYRCKIWDCTDSFAVFSTQSDGLVNVLVEGCYSPNMVQWRPDYAYSGGRSHTHNDTIQFQGNLGDVNDAIFTGNSFYAKFVTYAGTQPLESTRQHQAAIMITPNVPDVAGIANRVSATFHRNWLRGGIHTVNGGSDTNTSGRIVFTENRFQRPGVGEFAPTVALSLNSAYPRTVSGNTYIDNGQPVPVSNG